MHVTGNGSPPPPQDSPADPFADMPPTPHPTPVGVTADAFTIAPQQLYTNHGYATVTGSVFPTGWSGFSLKPAAGDALRLYPSWQWWNAHDLVVECWGRFGTNAMRFSLQSYDTQWDELGAVVVSPPVGGEGRIKVALPTAGLPILDYFNVDIRDADGSGTKATIYQCSMERD